LGISPEGRISSSL